jgi:DNA-binding MarR family transcriptional regulator
VSRPPRSGAVTGGVHTSPLLSDAVAYRIHQTNRLLLTHLGRFLETSKRGLTPEKWFVLARLRQDAPLRQSQLVELALEDGPNVSRLVDGMVNAGLVERSLDPTDRRGRVLDLTEHGRVVADELFGRAIVERARVFAGFSEDELKLLTVALERIDTNVRAMLLGEVLQ